MGCTNQIQEVANLSKEELAKALKKKVTCEVDLFLSYLQKGYIKDFNFIIEEIQLLEMLEDETITAPLDLYTLQYYLNNIWITS